MAQIRSSSLHTRRSNGSDAFDAVPHHMQQVTAQSDDAVIQLSVLVIIIAIPYSELTRITTKGSQKSAFLQTTVSVGLPLI